MLLFDQNISFRIVRLLRIDYPGCAHISKQGLLGASDRKIWSHAKRTGSAVAPFDQDYIELATISGSPPKVILLRNGNAGTLAISHLQRKHRERITMFISDTSPNAPAVLELP